MSQSLSQRFLTWCRSKPADETFDPGDGRACAGYQFLSDNGFPVRVCGTYLWEDDNRDIHHLPEPVGDAIHWAMWETGEVTFGALADRLEAALS